MSIIFDQSKSCLQKGFINVKLYLGGKICPFWQIIFFSTHFGHYYEKVHQNGENFTNFVFL